MVPASGPVMCGVLAAYLATAGIIPSKQVVPNMCRSSATSMLSSSSAAKPTCSHGVLLQSSNLLTVKFKVLHS